MLTNFLIGQQYGELDNIIHDRVRDLKMKWVPN